MEKEGSTPVRREAGSRSQAGGGAGEAGGSAVSADRRGAGREVGPNFDSTEILTEIFRIRNDLKSVPPITGRIRFGDGRDRFGIGTIRARDVSDCCATSGVT